MNKDIGFFLKSSNSDVQFEELSTGAIVSVYNLTPIDEPSAYTLGVKIVRKSYNEDQDICETKFALTPEAATALGVLLMTNKQVIEYIGK